MRNQVSTLRTSSKYSDGIMPELPDYTLSEFHVDIATLPDSWDAKRVMEMFQQQGIMFARTEIKNQMVGTYYRKMLLLL